MKQLAKIHVLTHYYLPYRCFHQNKSVILSTTVGLRDRYNKRQKKDIYIYILESLEF